ncbi:hypothetical protein RND81_03G079900 [Saponaria officinalis]|uniref:NAC domain-containing protein n=1 Tax=Saponaria officinalis TaxID=3572 RepID=A0AAW1M518_SAPOF
MDDYYSRAMEDEQMELPPGFRFHPTDEELITHYLCQKFLDINFNAIAIGEADLNKIEPWDLPKIAKMGEKEWYFFCVRDRKYPTGLRTNRATEAGYWKATGKDKEIYRANVLVGMKKTLVFYTGRAPKGEKTNWVMHEFRLEGQNPMFTHIHNSKSEWVISRVFDKGLGPKKSIYDLESSTLRQEELQQKSHMPPLIESSSPPDTETMATTYDNPSDVTCFSDPPLIGDHQHDEAPSLLELLTHQELVDFGLVDSFFGQEQPFLKLTPKDQVSQQPVSTNNGGDLNDNLWSF